MLIVVLLCVASFIFYDQFYDMSVTSKQSSDLLDLIFSGNMLNFYTYVNMSAAYNIVLYLALAIWELPIYIINHIFALSNYDIVLEFWARFLSITLFCVCSYQMTKLSEMLMSDKVKAKWAGYYFISSPIIAYCVIIRNQLDIIPVLLIIFSIK